MPTIGVDFKIKTVDVDSKQIKLQIWDTAGQERFKTITSSYYKGAHGIIVVYDITDRESFSNIQTWMAEVEKHACDNISRILVGNKCDLETSRQVSFEEGQELADHYNVRFMETSAKDSKNVEQAFTLMTREIKNKVAVTQTKRTNAQPAQAAAKLSGAKQVKQEKKGCC